MDAFFKNNLTTITDDLNEQTRLVINNVVKVFLELSDEDKRSQVDFTNPAKLTAQCCGVSVKTVEEIHFEYNTHEYDLHAMRGKPINNIDDLDKSAIRDIVSSHYVNGNFPSIIKVIDVAKERIENFKCSVPSMKGILTELGFKYKRTADGKKKLVEKKSIVAARLEFLRRMDELKKGDTRPRIYIDEVWISRYFYKVRISETFLSRGRKYIICHAGSAQTGFIENVAWIFRTKKVSSKNSAQLTAKTFVEWFMTLLRGLKEPCVIILDNASYHSKRNNTGPSSSSSKEEIKQWLKDNEIAYCETALKEELLQVVKEHRPKKDYEVDKLANSYGHEVVRLPLFHNVYNPMAFICEKIRKEVDEKAVKCYGEVDIKDYVHEAVDNVTKEDWADAVAKAEARQDEDFKKALTNDHVTEDEDEIESD